MIREAEGLSTTRQDDYYDDGVIAFFPSSAPLVNFASSSNGGVASASAAQASGFFNPNRANDGLRNTNNNWGTGASPGGGWDAGVDPAVTPSWLQIDFGSTKAIKEVDVITLADAANYTNDPTLSDTFTLYGVTDYKVQSSPDASAWTDQVTVSANNKVWRKHTVNFSARYMRILITGGAGNDARVVELEAWG
jgi:hypothetical protein